VDASKKRKADAYTKAVGKRTKLPTKRKAGPLKIGVPKAKLGVKRPSDMELDLEKPVKRMKKFVLDSPMAPVSGLGNAGASSSKALVVASKKVATSVKGQQIQASLMLVAALPTESQESSPHNSTPKTSEEAPAIAAELAVTSTAADTMASLLIVTTAGGSRATTSFAFVTTSAG
jgi:hypothetical protein